MRTGAGGQPRPAAGVVPVTAVLVLVAPDGPRRADGGLPGPAAVAGAGACRCGRPEAGPMRGQSRPAAGGTGE